MKAADFRPYFGLQVMLQFKESIVLAKAGPNEIGVPKFNAVGKPTTREGFDARDQKEMLVQKTWEIEPQANDDAALTFTFVLAGAMVLPHPQDETKVLITYKSGSALIEMLVDPDHILLCQTVRGKQEAESRIVPAQA